MKSVVYGLLATSLAANAVLLLLPRTTESAVKEISVGPSTTSTSTSAAIAKPKSNSAAKAMAWRPGSSDDTFRAIADDLRKAGFPSRVIATVITAAYREKLAAGDPALQGPYWQRNSQAVQEAQTEYFRDGEKRLDTLLGPDARLSSQLDPMDRQLRYGNLSDEKIDSLKYVERDYAELRRDMQQAAFRRAPIQKDFDALAEKERLLKREIATDLAAALTPAEQQDYEMRNSETSWSVSNSVREIDVSPEEFAALYNLQKKTDDANPRAGGAYSVEQVIKSQTEYQAANEQAKALLGDARFYQYLSSRDPSYRELTALAGQYPRISPAIAYQVTLLKTEAMKVQQNMGPNSQISAEEITANYIRLNTRLESLVGPDAAEAIKKLPSNGMLKAPNVIPSSSQPPHK